MNKRTRYPCELAVIINLIIACAVWPDPFVINSAGEKMNGTKILSAKDGTVQLTTISGHVLTFPNGSYRQAMADRPAELDDVKRLVKKGDLENVAEVLEKVKEEYRFLGWDQRAGLMLARVYLPLKRFEDSVREYEELFMVRPQLKIDFKERSNYMQALLGAGRMQDVIRMIEEDIVSGSREAAARAQIIRGDIKFSGGQCQEAFFDYFRTTHFFRTQKDVLPEATYKTAVVLEKMNDSRSKTYFKKVIDEFPGTEYAVQAKENLNKEERYRDE